MEALLEYLNKDLEEGKSINIQKVFEIISVNISTAVSGSLIASIKCYKSERSPRYHTRVVTFCEPVLAGMSSINCYGHFFILITATFLSRGKK